VAASVNILLIVLGRAESSSPPAVLPPASVGSSLAPLRAPAPGVTAAVVSRSLLVHGVERGDDAVAELAENWPARMDWVVRPDLVRCELT
jgi:hypothetical protein